jgi:hypothetical protein
VSIGIWYQGFYDHGEFPVKVGTPVTDDLDTYVATVSSLEIINYNPATQYAYTNMSGSASSVVIIIHESKFTISKIAGIVVGGLAGIVIIVGTLVYWLRSRKTNRIAFDSAGDGFQPLNAKSTKDQEIVDFSTTRNPTVTTLHYAEDIELPELNLAIPFGEETRPGGRLGPSLDLETRPGGRLGSSSETRLGGRLGTSLETSYRG